MPMLSRNPGTNISEFHHGTRYQSMLKKYGRSKANQIAVAAGMSAARKAGNKAAAMYKGLSK